MTTPARVAAAAVIGVLAIGGTLLLIGSAGQPRVGGPAASPSPTSSVPASIAAATPPSDAPPSLLPDDPDGVLAAGTYVATPFAPGPIPFCMSPPQPGCSESEDDSIRVTFTVPDGWAAFFRENHHFDALASYMIPEALKRNQTARRLRIYRGPGGAR